MIGIANGLARAGRSVDFVVFQQCDTLESNLDENIRVFKLDAPLQGRGFVRAAWRLARYLRHRRPGRLMSTLEPPTVVAWFASRLVVRSPELFIRVGTTYSRWPRSVLRERVVGSVYRRHRGGFIANSVGARDDLCAAFGFDAKRVDVIYNGLDLAAIDEKSRQAPEGRLPGGSGGYLLSVGRLARDKGHDVLIRAFARISGQVPFDLLIRGEGAYRSRLEELVIELGLEGRVHMPGVADNPFPFYRQARATVLASRLEGMPNVLMEALACGCPVIATDCESGPAEILEHGKWGKLVPVGDVSALAEAMLGVAADETAPDEAERSRLKERAGQFSLERATAAYLGVLFDQPSPSLEKQRVIS